MRYPETVKLWKSIFAPSAESSCLKSAVRDRKSEIDFVPVVQRRKRSFLRRNWLFITLRQQSSQLRKPPLVSSLHWKLRRPVSSGICPFLRSRVTQRVTQKTRNGVSLSTKCCDSLTFVIATCDAYIRKAAFDGRGCFIIRCD
jgi:hypothetical protein